MSVNYPRDAQARWHHRIMMVQLEGPRWVWITPDLDVEVGDMSHQTIRTLARSALYHDLGTDIECEAYGFDGKLDAADLVWARAEARRLGVTWYYRARRGSRIAGRQVVVRRSRVRGLPEGGPEPPLGHIRLFHPSRVFGSRARQR